MVSMQIHPVMGGLIALSVVVLMYSLIFKVVTIKEIILLMRSVFST